MEQASLVVVVVAEFVPEQPLVVVQVDVQDSDPEGVELVGVTQVVEQIEYVTVGEVHDSVSVDVSVGVPVDVPVDVGSWLPVSVVGCSS